MKETKGITLIALVITIIVLLILAGVAISMLSGENGILTRAVEAKEKTEEAQKEEAGALLSYELVLNNSKYKYQYGYLTGFELNETVANVETALQELSSGYKVSSKYNYRENTDETIEEEEKESLSIATGMTITKDGQEVARTVVFGDMNCDGEVDDEDAAYALNYFRFYNKNKAYGKCKDFQKVAVNLCVDDELNYDDVILITKFIAETLDEGVNLQETIINSNQKLKRYYTEIQEYISLLDEESTGYSFEYNEETDTYKLKGVTANTTAESLKNSLPQTENITIQKINEENKYEEITGEKIVQDGYYLQLQTLVDKEGTTQQKLIFAYIEVK